LKLYLEELLCGKKYTLARSQRKDEVINKKETEFGVKHLNISLSTVLYIVT
jgi:hypothetical protein